MPIAEIVTDTCPDDTWPPAMIEACSAPIHESSPPPRMKATVSPSATNEPLRVMVDTVDWKMAVGEIATSGGEGLGDGGAEGGNGGGRGAGEGGGGEGLGGGGDGGGGEGWEGGGGEGDGGGGSLGLGAAGGGKG